jgi:type VI secretion system secreted protein Hcp
MSIRFGAEKVRSVAYMAFLVSTWTHADQIYVSIEGARQGVFKGDSTRVPGKTEATKFGFQVSVPVSMPGGEPTGRRAYGPAHITKRVDATSPQLLQALIGNEVLKSVTIDIVESATTGAARLAHSLLLQDARLTGIERFTEPDGAGGLRALEEISFVYGRIQDRNVRGQTTAVDDMRPGIR